MGEEETRDGAAEPADQPEQLEIDLYPELVAFSEEPEEKGTASGAAPARAARAEERPQHPAGHPVARPAAPLGPKTHPDGQPGERPAAPLGPKTEPAQSANVPELTRGNNGKQRAAAESRTQIAGNSCSECGKQFHSEELFCPVCGAFTG